MQMLWNWWTFRFGLHTVILSPHIFVRLCWFYFPVLSISLSLSLCPWVCLYMSDGICYFVQLKRRVFPKILISFHLCFISRTIFLDTIRKWLAVLNFSLRNLFEISISFAHSCNWTLLNEWQKNKRTQLNQ